MNYLAHLFLSGIDNEIIIGNFIGDFIKGKDFTYLPKQVQAGVSLHRRIDSFTDNHPIVRRSMHRLNERYRHYDGVIIDIFYDHFLAKNWDKYSSESLNHFIKKIYSLLEQHSDSLPLKAQKIIPAMISQNWLGKYASIQGINEVLEGMNKRTKGKSKMNFAIDDLQLYYLEFEKDFLEFFIDLELFCKDFIKTNCSL